MSEQTDAKAMVEEARKSHNAPIIRSLSDFTPQLGRFKNETQMVFHPTPDHPTEPNAGLLNYLPGAGFPLHKHEFAQVWYVIEGECSFGDNRLTAGDMVYMADPHFEYGMHTDSGCKILFLQYPGPTTGANPVYEGRFNMAATKSLDEEDLDH